MLFLTLLLSGCNAGSKAVGPNTDKPEAQQVRAGGDRADAADTVQLSDSTREPKAEAASAPKIKQAAAQKDSVDSEKTVQSANTPGNAGVSSNKEEPGPRVRLVVTRDFGQSLISDRWVALTGSATAMGVTTANLDTKTAYGGSFITSINGIVSGYTGKTAWDKEKRDWFFYYNGKMGNTSASNIKLKSGDIVWWDYHDWSGEAKPLPAVPPTK